MISYQISDVGVFPRLCCDVCHKPIDDEHGFAHASESGETTFAHAGQCDHKVRHTPASLFGSDRLPAFFARLLHNTNIGPKELADADPILRDGFIGIVASRKKLNRERP